MMSPGNCGTLRQCWGKGGKSPVAFSAPHKTIPGRCASSYFFKCTTLRPCPKGIPHPRLCCRLFTAWCRHWGATQLFWALVWQLFCSTSAKKKSVADLSRPACEGITILTASPLAMLGQGCGCVVNKLAFFVLLKMSPQWKEIYPDMVQIHIFWYVIYITIHTLPLKRPVQNLCPYLPCNPSG